MMDTEGTSEMSVNFYLTTGRNIPAYCQQYSRRCENLKSLVLFIYVLHTLIHGFVFQEILIYM